MDRVSGDGLKARRVWHGQTDSLPEKFFTDDIAWDKDNTHTKDLQSLLPVQHLKAFQQSGRSGALGPRFYGAPTDYSQRRTVEQDAPTLLAMAREDGLDAVVFGPL